MKQIIFYRNTNRKCARMPKYYTMPSQMLFLLNLCCLIFEVTSYPVDKLSSDFPEPELKDETRYDNGTVVGKYSYTDNEGNPIHVKYYADDSSYGVELKSVKIVNTATEEPTWQSSNFDILKPIESPFGTPSLLTLGNEITKKKPDSKNKDDKKNYPYKAKSAEYETFYQNEIKTPGQNGKDRVRVYLDKEKRIIRRALDNYRASKYCGRI